MAPSGCGGAGEFRSGTSFDLSSCGTLFMGPHDCGVATVASVIRSDGDRRSFGDTHGHWLDARLVSLFPDFSDPGSLANPSGPMDAMGASCVGESRRVRCRANL